MFRSTTSIVALLAAMTMPAIAADYGDWGVDLDSPSDLREGYPTEPKDWSDLGDETDPVSFEIGMRYVYSIGSSSFGGGALTTSDTSHIGELHLRIEDHSTNSFVKGNVGYSIASIGPTNGQVSYIGGDIGWDPIGDSKGSGAGFLVGYQYMKDATGGRTNYTTLNGGDAVTTDPVTGATTIGGFSTANSVNVQVLRMGVQGKAMLGDYFDISGEIAAVPYANVSGTVTPEDPTFSTAVYAGAAQFPYSGVANGNISSMRSSPTDIAGWGYGAQAEGWIGAHPTENLTVRFGARASYLQGTTDATYTRVFIPDPGGVAPAYTAPVAVETSILSLAQPFKMIRYGLMAEFTYDF
ncbi:MAG: hypothetical protein ABIQ30_04220 [Devosia sp.]